jgi:predicted AAA-ATPase/PD-(D/E)XK nuclease superfamily protein
MLMRLPLDLSTFATIRKENYLYVDKTQFAYNLITGGRRYFLSRPRRFGKSLFVSTLKEILEGNKSLFKGLSIEESDYHWNKYGVINLDFSAIDVANAEDFRIRICQLLQLVAEDYGLEIILPERPDSALVLLVRALFKKFERVAILVDEYDNPILQTINNPDEAKNVRNAIRRFFTVIKSLDAFVDFVFITGVSSFARAGLFSGINNLRIITLDKRFATICGYTDEEVDNYFNAYIKAWAKIEEKPFDALRTQIKEWYNGYYFAPNAPSVYNPFSIMNAIDSQDFKNFWFQSGTPTFLVEELTKEYRRSEFHLFDLETLEATEDSLGIFDVGATPLVSLMFQTGYLTINKFDKDKRSFELRCPNLEVRAALYKYLLGIYANLSLPETERISLKLFDALSKKNITVLVALLKNLISRVPYQLHENEEKFYHALLQVIFSSSGISAQSEISISHGRIDIVLELPTRFYVIEVKLNSSADKALAQIEARKYYESLLHHGKPIELLGLNFMRRPKEFEIEAAHKTISM